MSVYQKVVTRVILLSWSRHLESRRRGFQINLNYSYQRLTRVEQIVHRLNISQHISVFIEIQ